MSPQRAITIPALILVVLIAIYTVAFSHLTLTRYAAFEARALDMGNLNQATWNTAHGNWFHLTNQPGTINRLSLHVEPILIPIAGLYRIYMAFLSPAAQTAGGPPFLIVLQSLVVALGAWPVFALARRVLANAWVGLALALAFLLNPSIQAANWLEFHPVTLAPTFLLAAFYFLYVGRTGWFAGFAILAASCKEEIGLLVFMMGLYALLFGQDGVRSLKDETGTRNVFNAQPSSSILMRRRVGAVTMICALGWSLFAVLGMQNFFAGGNIHWGRYGYLGDSPGQMVIALLTRPDIVLAQLQAADALRYLHELLAPVGYLPLLAPHVFLLALPSLGINLLADFPPMHQVTTLIYAAPIMPFAVLAAILGAARLQAWLAFIPRPSSLILIALLVVGAAATQYRAHGYLPGGGNHRLYAVTEHHRRAAEILAQIPPDASVSAQDKLNPHVSGRETVYIFPRIHENNDITPEDVGRDGASAVDPAGLADMVLVDVTGPAWPQHPNDLYISIQALLAGPYGIHAAEDGYLLLSRKAQAKTLPPAFYSAWQTDAASLSLPGRLDAPIDFGDQLRLLDYAVTTDAHGELVTRFYWQGLASAEGVTGAPSAEQALNFYVAYQDREGHILYNTEFYPPVAQLWYPTVMWPPGATMMVETLPWTLDGASAVTGSRDPDQTAQFGLYVGVYPDPHAGSPREHLLPVTNGGTGLPVFAQGGLVRLGGYARAAGGAGWQAMSPAGTAWGGDAQRLELDAVFDGQFALRAVDVAPVEGAVMFTLHWEGLASMQEDYTVFVHLLDETGARLAQWDDAPRDAIGPRPTTGWQVGERLADTRRFDLPDHVENEGAWRLAVGAYFWADGGEHLAHLPVDGVDAGPGDVVEIGIWE